MSTPDIREGDLVKATRKDERGLTVTGRVKYVTRDGEGFDFEGGLGGFYEMSWDFEVLDRPLPPISEELLTDAINAWRKEYYGHPPVDDVADDPKYRAEISAVINTVREYDSKNNTKENA